MSEVNKKPPIIARKTISDNKSLEAVIVAIITAQRDADYEYQQKVIRQIFGEILDYAELRCMALRNQKDCEICTKSTEIQKKQVLGGKIRAFQEMIDKLQSLKSKFGVK